MEIARQLFAVTLVLGLLAAGVWTLRRGPVVPPARWWARWTRAGGLRAVVGSPLPGRALVLERAGRLALTPQHTLHLVRIQGLEMAVVTHPQGCSVVGGSAAPPAPAARFEAGGGAGA